MGISRFSVDFERDLYHPGQVVSGRVCLTLDKPKEIRAIDFKLCGKAKFHWTEEKLETDSEGKTHQVTLSHYGKENYINVKTTLVGGKGNTFELPIGEYSYPFSVILPNNVPSTFNGQYGGIIYFGKAKLDIPWAVDKKEKKYFQVLNLLNLNNFRHLNAPLKDEKSKTFCCCWCTSGPFALIIYLPRTGYAFYESIPITIEVDNASNVDIDCVEAKLYQKIRWQAQDDSKSEIIKLKSINFGVVTQRSSKTWSESMQLGPNRYPNFSGCSIIHLTHELKIEADPSGPHLDLEIVVPITVADIGFDESPNTVPHVSTFPGSQPFSQSMDALKPNIGFNSLLADASNPGTEFMTPSNESAPYPNASYPVPLNPVISSIIQPEPIPYSIQQPRASPYPFQQSEIYNPAASNTAKIASCIFIPETPSAPSVTEFSFNDSSLSKTNDVERSKSNFLTNDQDRKSVV